MKQLEAAGADAVGTNCGLGITTVIPSMKKISQGEERM